MRWRCDQTAGALYFTFEDGAANRQVELSRDVIVDLGEEDRVLGVEILFPLDQSGAQALSKSLPQKDAQLVTSVVFAFQGGLAHDQDRQIRLRSRKTDSGSILYA
jgi:uncharacterized protein YuzE